MEAVALGVRGQEVVDHGEEEDPEEVEVAGGATGGAVGGATPEDGGEEEGEEGAAAVEAATFPSLR